jgi:diacylglycerol kinase (ATP)
VKKFLTGLGYAINGIQKAIVSECNLKVELFIAACVVLLGFILTLSLMEWVIIVCCIGSVITAELLNTAIEKMVDLVSPSFNPQAGLIKDIAAGAVLVCAVVSVIVGGCIFIPKLR